MKPRRDDQINNWITADALRDMLTTGGFNERSREVIDGRTVVLLHHPEDHYETFRTLFEPGPRVGDQMELL